MPASFRSSPDVGGRAFLTLEVFRFEIGRVGKRSTARETALPAGDRLNAAAA